MKKFVKVISLVMAVTMFAASFAGCGGNSDKSSSTAKSGGEFFIGGSGPLTGAAAIYGTAVQKGAQLAVDEINAAGGINGMTVKFSMQDDENNAEKANNAYNKLKDDGMKVFMGTVTSTPCVSIEEIAQSDNMFLITPSGSAVDCVKGDNAYRICFKDPDQGKASAQYISANKLATKVAAIYDSSDVYSTGIFKEFKQEAANRKLELVTEQAFTQSNNTDFSVAIQKIKESGAELVFLPIYYQQAALIVTQANKAGLKVKYFGCDGLDGLIKQLGNDSKLADGIMLLTPYAPDSKDEKSQEFTKAYKEKYNETPIQFAADAYDAIYTIKTAAEEADVKADMSYSDVCDAMKKVMTKITVKGVTGEMTWNAEGEPTKTPKAMYIDNGAYKAMD